MYAPAALVVPVPTVDHVLDPDARRCTTTDRATNPLPVLTDTASLTTYPTAPLAAVVDHPDTTVAVAACAGTDTPTKPTHATTSATHTRRTHRPSLQHPCNTSLVTLNQRTLGASSTHAPAVLRFLAP